MKSQKDAINLLQTEVKNLKHEMHALKDIIKRANTEVNEDYKKTNIPVRPELGLYYPRSEEAIVPTLAGKVDAIIEHLGIRVDYQKGTDGKVKVTKLSKGE